MAIRRTTRVKEKSGAILEDLGVEPDVHYRMTRQDVMGHNEGLIDTAIEQLAGRSVHSLDLTGMQRHRNRAPTLALVAQNVERIETTADGRNLPSTPVRASKATVELGDVVGPGTTGTVTVRFLGYLGQELVAERIVQINLD